MKSPDFQKHVALPHILPPRISISGSRAAYIGPGLDLSPHRNAAATVAIALREPFELTLLDTHGEPAPACTTYTKRIFLIPPGALHHLRTYGDMVFVYLDVLSDDHDRFSRLDLDAAYWSLMGKSSVGLANVDAICHGLGIPQRVVGGSPVARVVRLIDHRPQDFPRTKDAARLAWMSVSRFQHLFRQTTGMPFRRYRLWRRMAVVMHVLASGRTLTEAAYEAGFSSSAHLSATFKAMFGIRPSDLVSLGTTFGIEDFEP